LKKKSSQQFVIASEIIQHFYWVDWGENRIEVKNLTMIPKIDKE
jgi:hypothetical protein